MRAVMSDGARAETLAYSSPPAQPASSGPQSALRSRDSSAVTNSVAVIFLFCTHRRHCPRGLPLLKGPLAPCAPKFTRLNFSSSPLGPTDSCGAAETPRYTIACRPRCTLLTAPTSVQSASPAAARSAFV